MARISARRRIRFNLSITEFAGADHGVGVGDVGVRLDLPRRLEHLRCLSDVAGTAEEPRGDDRRRSEAGLEAVRFKRRGTRLVRLSRFELHGPRGEQRRAHPLGIGLVGESGPDIGVKRLERVQPVALAGGVLEERRPGPADAGRGPGGFLGEVPGGLMLVLTLRLDEKAVEAEKFGIAARGQRLEGRARRGAVPGKLRRLSGEEKHQRLGAEEGAQFVGRLPCGAGIAGADRDDARGQRPVAAVAPATAEVGAEGARGAEDRA